MATCFHIELDFCNWYMRAVSWIVMLVEMWRTLEIIGLGARYGEYGECGGNSKHICHWFNWLVTQMIVSSPCTYLAESSREKYSTYFLLSLSISYHLTAIQNSFVDFLLFAYVTVSFVRLLSSLSSVLIWSVRNLTNHLRVVASLDAFIEPPFLGSAAFFLINKCCFINTQSSLLPVFIYTHVL